MSGGTSEPPPPPHPVLHAGAGLTGGAGSRRRSRGSSNQEAGDVNERRCVTASPSARTRILVRADGGPGASPGQEEQDGGLQLPICIQRGRQTAPAPRLPPRILINPSGAPSGGRLQLSRLSKTSFSLNPLREKLHRKQTALKLTVVFPSLSSSQHRRDVLFCHGCFGVCFSHQSRNHHRLHLKCDACARSPGDVQRCSHLELPSDAETSAART